MSLSSVKPDRLLVLNIDFRLLMIFSVGSLGGTTFSIKWLVHSVAKCKWHLDRRYWRFFVPMIGGYTRVWFLLSLMVE
jgi:hypothetical protein